MMVNPLDCCSSTTSNATHLYHVTRNVLAGIHRQKGCERLKRAVEELAQGLNADVGDLLRPRTEVEAAADTARLSDHFPFELASPELRPDQALHPYALELFQEPFITMVAVLVGGRERVFVNAAWAKSFFDAEACRQKLQDEGLRPSEIFGSVVHPDDRAFVVPLVDNCLFGCPDTLCESAHILRVRVRECVGSLVVFWVGWVVGWVGGWVFVQRCRAC